MFSTISDMTELLVFLKLTFVKAVWANAGGGGQFFW